MPSKDKPLQLASMAVHAVSRWRGSHVRSSLRVSLWLHLGDARLHRLNGLHTTAQGPPRCAAAEDDRWRAPCGGPHVSRS